MTPAGPSENENPSGSADADEQEARSRREYVWAGMGAESDNQLFSTPLRKIQQQFKKAIDHHRLTKRGMRRLWNSNDQSLSMHMCTSYLKEEIVLGPTPADSAILLSSRPSIREVCFVCGRHATIPVDAIDETDHQLHQSDVSSQAANSSHRYVIVLHRRRQLS
jgi:hypothetical protein